MKYNRETVERALRALENDKIRAEAAAAARRREVYELLPRVAEIDAALRATVLDIIRASFGKGEDTAALIRKTREKNLELTREREELLIAAGYNGDSLEPIYSCDVCNDTGYAGGELCPCVLRRCRKAAAEEINSRLNLKNCDFSEFDISLYPESGMHMSPRSQMREVLQFALSYAEGFGDDSENLYMSGGSGLGKTFLASCIARKVADAGFSVVYDTAFSILGAYEDVKFGRGERDTTVFETCDLLIIDDVGCEMKTPFTVAALFNLINVRKNTDRKTVIISPLSEAEIKRDYGIPFHSRLRGEFVKLEFLGNDVRLMR